MENQEPIVPADTYGILFEPNRLAAIQRLGLLDTATDSALDSFMRLVVRALCVPTALIVIGDEGTAWVKSSAGVFEASASPHTLAALRAIVQTIIITRPAHSIADTQRPWPPDHPSQHVPSFAACVAVPLVTSDDHTVGALCVFDMVQRTWSEDLIASLQEFATHCIGDIEQRCETADLRAREELYRTLFAHAPIGQSLGTADGWILTANPALCEMLGYTEEEILRLHFPTLTHPDDRQLTFEYMQRMVAGERPSFDFEKRYIRKDGSVLHVRSSVALVRDAQGQPKYGIGIIQDIGERKRLEAQLIQAQRMESVGRLAGGIAHDFNNLLMAIIGYAELARDSLTPDVPVWDDLAAIKDAAERGALLTRQLLAFGRKQIMAPIVLNLNTLILDIDKLLRRLIGEDIDIVTYCDADLRNIKADPSQIEQVLINLAVNARDAMPQGGKLTIETSNVVLNDSYTREHIDASVGAHVLLAISDNGVGMAPEVRARAFEPFFTTKDPGLGTGLGLATCYGIVKQHGGSISIYSEPNQGTAVKIYLPAVVDKVVEPLLDDNATALPRGTETVLLVEDDVVVRAFISRVLREHGYHVLEAGNGADALSTAQQEPRPAPRLLLTDVVMPEMSGKALATHIVQRYPGIKVLFMSGYTGNMLTRHGQLEAGVKLLQKPFSTATLVHAVRAAFDN
jgi:PAS domain S-box-containing protein